MYRYLFLFLLALLPMSILSAQNPLPDCPKSPNCFRSEQNSNRAAQKTLPFNQDLRKSQQLLKEVLADYPSAEYVSTEDEIVSYRFTTKLGKFTDQVTFYFDEEIRGIHFRSASEVGWYDMGANKRRTKKIRKMWLATFPKK